MTIQISKARVNNPNAIVIIYNYRDRLGDFKLSNDPHEVEQTILNSLSLKSVSTSKSKANPAGSFEFRLAPIKNWVTAITPGSWCVILMSNSALNDAAKYGGETVDEKSFKMMGRIESVRCVISVNQLTGARESEYIVTGSDWGTIFNSMLYVDPVDATPGDNKQPVGMAERFGYTDYLINAIGADTAVVLGKGANPIIGAGASANAKTPEQKGSINHSVDFLGNGATSAPVSPLAPVATPTTSGQLPKDATPTLPTALQNILFILSLWGRSNKATAEVKTEAGIMGKSEQVFKIPNDLKKYMGFKDTAIAQILQPVTGVLIANDVYNSKEESCGIVDFTTILGEHSLWQLLTSNSNSLINELIAEIRFTDGVPKLAIYNRVKPFAVNSLEFIKSDTNAVGDGGKVGNQIKTQKALVDPYISKFSNVKKRRIRSDDVLLCNYGTNWRDRVNFIEVTIAKTLFQQSWAADIKLASQFVDESSIGRDGLLSMITSTSYFPIKDKQANPEGVSAYKHALKEWYFNTHKMFNGSLNLIGQDQYIQVGDNIMVESKVLNKNYNINLAQKTTSTQTYLLAHVESISHQSQVDNNGARTFSTSITFVRGIITDEKGRMIVSDMHVGAVDQDAKLVPPSTERNRETHNTSSPTDPDRQRYPIKKSQKDYDEE